MATFSIPNRVAETLLQTEAVIASTMEPNTLVGICNRLIGSFERVEYQVRKNPNTNAITFPVVELSTQSTMIDTSTNQQKQQGSIANRIFF